MSGRNSYGRVTMRTARILTRREFVSSLTIDGCILANGNKGGFWSEVRIQTYRCSKGIDRSAFQGFRRDKAFLQRISRSLKRKVERPRVQEREPYKVWKN